MGTAIGAGTVSQLPPGSMKQVKSGGSDILVANVGGKIYAIDNRCPHMGGNLSKGALEGAIVTCPLHGSQIDVTSGRVVRWMKGSGLASKIGNAFNHPSEVKQYEVTVSGDNISLKI
jgi:3-phenylpropionate/trans-cinnamate dioxygenase ferredoxin component